MKIAGIFAGLSLAFCINAQPIFKEDVLKNGFVQATIQQPDDYDGKVVTTLVKKTKPGNKKAVLYVHGYSDYFFQIEMAEKYLAHGYDFYAVDLRKYGRSRLPHQRFYNVRDIHEYDADLDTALRIIKTGKYTKVLLSGHSTGGLVVTCYAHKNLGKEMFDGLFLNSPFLDMNLGEFTEDVTVPLGSLMGSLNPKGEAGSDFNPNYGLSLHKRYKGEWEFDTAWKPIYLAPNVNYAFLKAIHHGHKEVQKGNCVNKPVLVMSSDSSVYGNLWNDAYLRGDGVLDVNDIKKYGIQLGSQVTYLPIEDGMHDLVLSNKKAREELYTVLFLWLEKNLK